MEKKNCVVLSSSFSRRNVYYSFLNQSSSHADQRTFTTHQLVLSSKIISFKANESPMLLQRFPTPNSHHPPSTCRTFYRNMLIEIHYCQAWFTRHCRRLCMVNARKKKKIITQIQQKRTFAVFVNICSDNFSLV